MKYDFNNTKEQNLTILLNHILQFMQNFNYS